MDYELINMLHHSLIHSIWAQMRSRAVRLCLIESIVEVMMMGLMHGGQMTEEMRHSLLPPSPSSAGAFSLMEQGELELSLSNFHFRIFKVSLIHLLYWFNRLLPTDLNELMTNKILNRLGFIIIIYDEDIVFSENKISLIDWLIRILRHSSFNSMEIRGFYRRERGALPSSAARIFDLKIWIKLH